MIDFTTLPPMPPTNCPKWCQHDHAMDWARDVAEQLGRNSPIDDELLATVFPRLHVAPLLQIELAEEGDATAEMVQADQDAPYLYLDATGPATAEQARAFAAALLAGADRLDAA